MICSLSGSAEASAGRRGGDASVLGVRGVEEEEERECLAETAEGEEERR
jgi:hypothetical protein